MQAASGQVVINPLARYNRWDRRVCLQMLKPSHVPWTCRPILCGLFVLPHRVWIENEKTDNALHYFRDVWQTTFKLLSAHANSIENQYGITQNVSFIHIPKTGGESIFHSALRAEIYWSRIYDYPRFRGLSQVNVQSDGPDVCSNGSWNRGCCSWFHIPGSYLHDPRGYLQAPLRFCVLRDPIDRMVSEFYWQHKQSSQECCDGGHACEAFNVNAFNLQIMKMINASNQKPYAFDCHLLPQAAFVSTSFVFASDISHSIREKHLSNDQLCNVVLRTERLEEDFELLMLYLGLNVSLLHTNSKPKHCANGKLPSRHELDRRTVAAIQSKFSVDFQRFAFEVKSPRYPRPSRNTIGRR